MGQWMRVGSSHRGRGYQLGRTQFSPSGCWICTCIEVFLIRKWCLILPTCGGTSTLVRGEIIAARKLHEPQPISDQWMGVGFSHRAERNRSLGFTFFVPGLLELYIYGRIPDPGMTPCPSRVRRDLDVGPRGSYRSALAPVCMFIRPIFGTQLVNLAPVVKRTNTL